MTKKSYELTDDGEQIDKLVDTGTPPNTPARIHPHCAYRWLMVDSDGAEITILVVDGLAKLRSQGREVLDYDGTVELDVGGEAVEIDVTDGTATREIDTEEPVEVQAMGLKEHPAEPSDTVGIEP